MVSKLAKYPVNKKPIIQQNIYTFFYSQNKQIKFSQSSVSKKTVVQDLIYKNIKQPISKTFLILGIPEKPQ